MKIIGAIGYTDKVDLMMCMAKTLDYMGKTILIVDATNDKKYKHIIPTIETTDKEYVTEFDRVDYAVGFDSLVDIENYMAEQKVNISLYDYMIIDIDSSKGFEFFRTRGFEKTLFFIDTSVLTVNKNREILDTIKVYNTSNEELSMTKVLYKGYLSRATEKYFSDKLEDFEIKWNENEFEVSEDEQDKMVFLDSEICGFIQVNKHSKMFVITLAKLIAHILDDVSQKDVMKNIKRGKF